MIVVYNLLVFIPVGVGLFVGLIFKALVGDRTAALFGGLAGAAADVVIRRSRQEPSDGLAMALVRPSAGGHFFYVPAWVWGAMATLSSFSPH